MKKIQIIRKIIQLSFIVLMVLGIYGKLRKTLILLLPLTLIIGNMFCAWICPFGTIQEIFSDIGTFIFKRKFKMPQFIQRYLQYSRYLIALLIAVFSLGEIYKPLNSYRNLFSLSKEISLSLGIIIMFSFLIISLLFERPFCNYFCTEAVKYGILNPLRIFSIKRNENSCVSCGKCDKVCPMNIKVSEKINVRSTQCINCFKCVESCPSKDTLKYKKVSDIKGIIITLSILVILIFLGDKLMKKGKEAPKGNTSKIEKVEVKK